MPNKRRTRSSRSTTNIQTTKQNNRNVRSTTRKTRSQYRNQANSSVDFSQLKIETLQEIRKHYKIPSKTKNRKILATLILKKFTEQVVNEKEVISEFLQVSQEY
ncbi:histone deacetylase complex subunit sap30l [Anaeramoeba flamelloides]|uniref:Histone deacetylase complex subunit sap30l n=1 Tax=Anaeramoeba flamelloides TaxID=1746091 RepID=A0AAV7YJZ4_9EUKA|nr:histone deacetylase complex subunit sap30l [Anaeramoeba flamelloides]KAJ6239231.1 histone deacetylase complex subunit sap30l [Anaeramoeba flamelloides]